MTKHAVTPDAARILMTAAAFVIVVAGLKAAASLVVPFLLSVFIAVVSAPLIYWLERRGLPRLLALLVVVTMVVGVGLLIALFVGASVKSFSSALPEYRGRLGALTGTIVDWLQAHGAPVTPSELRELVDLGRVVQLSAQVFDGVGNMLTNGFLILFTVVFILMEAASFPVKVRAIAIDAEESLSRFQTFTDKLRQYVVIKTWTSLGTGLAVGMWLHLLGVNYAILWGLLAFMLNYVPNIGSILAAVPAVLFAVVDVSVATAAWAALGFVVVNVVLGSVLEPRIMGAGLGLSALVVFISLVLWGWVLGPVGMFLSVPLTMTLQIALDSHEDTRWIAVLLGPAPRERGERAAAAKSGA